ncbi:UNVERIFIED_CONTAM: hypothetical protein FKN15_068989 [Acipenser sinensis]
MLSAYGTQCPAPQRQCTVTELHVLGVHGTRDTQYTVLGTHCYNASAGTHGAARYSMRSFGEGHEGELRVLYGRTVGGSWSPRAPPP